MPSKSSAARGFEEIWPVVAGRLRDRLRAKGLPPVQVDDVIQETAARIWERWDRLETERDLFPLAYTIARNLVIDRSREQKRVEFVAGLEGSAPDDPSEVVSARIELRRVLRALKTLTPRYRDLLLAEVGWTDRVSEPGAATNVARMRARRRLLAVLEKAGVFVTSPLVRLRSRFIERDGSRLRWPPELILRLGEIAVLCLLTVPALHGTPGNAGNLGGTTQPAAEVARAMPSAIPPAPSIAQDVDRVEKPFSSRASGSESSDRAPARVVDLPRAKGHLRSGGSFGAWGYDERYEGSTDVNGEQLRWEYRHRYRNPRCVRRAANGHVSTDCSGGRLPSGHVAVGYQDQKHRIDY